MLPFCRMFMFTHINWNWYEVYHKGQYDGEYVMSMSKYDQVQYAKNTNRIMGPEHWTRTGENGNGRKFTNKLYARMKNLLAEVHYEMCVGYQYNIKSRICPSTNGVPHLVRIAVPTIPATSRDLVCERNWPIDTLENEPVVRKWYIREMPLLPHVNIFDVSSRTKLKITSTLADVAKTNMYSAFST